MESYVDLPQANRNPMDYFLSSSCDPEEFEIMLDAVTRTMFGTGGSWKIGPRDKKTGTAGD
ncbi:MAG: hypothetical protein KAW17_11540 [Candidatus Eisenbacteria sp.]|nr:hypothetical protein [Candidatus Eisenbacteria bacterium]